MSVKYEVLKRLVRAAGLKKRWLSATTEELLENRRKQNAKNRIPALKDDAFEFIRIDVMGFPVLKLIHREHTNRANLFLIGRHDQRTEASLRQKGAAVCKGNRARSVHPLLSALHRLSADKSL